MPSWVAPLIDVLWQNALAAIPLALVVALICRWVKCRPATRHVLWLIVLLRLVAPPVLPSWRLPSLQTLHFSDRRLVAGDAAPAEPAFAIPTNTTTTKAVQPPKEDQHDGAAKFAGRTIRERHMPTLDAPRGTSDAIPATPVAAIARSDFADPLKKSSRDRSDRRTSSRTRSGARKSADRLVTLRQESPITVSAPKRDKRSTPETEILTKREKKTDWKVGPTPTPERARQVTRSVNEEAAPSILAAAGPESSPSTIPTGLKQSLGIDESGETQQLESDAAAASDSAWHRWWSGVQRVGLAFANLPPVPPTVWLGGTLALILGQVVCACRFRRRLRTAFRAPPSVERVVAACATELGLRKVPHTVMTDDQVSPMVWCGWGKRLILPAGLWADLDKLGRQAVVYHELAHLRRRDHWVCWIESLIGLVYWWNPLVWLIRRRLHAEADHSCDAWVTWLMPRGRRSYAEALLRTREYVTVNYPAAPVLGIGVATGPARQFARRLTMVMTESKRPRASANGIALGLSLALVAWIALPAQSCPPSKQNNKTASAPFVSAPVVVTAPSATVAPWRAIAPTAAVAPWRAIAPTAAVAPAAPNALSSFEAHLAQKNQASGGSGFAVVAGSGCSLCKSGSCKSCSKAISAGKKVSGACCASVGAKVAPFNTAIRQYTRAVEAYAPIASAISVGRAGGSPIAFLPSAPTAPLLFALGGADDGKTVTRSYKLPGGKLDALTELMIRQDVPILVSPRDDRLNVEATLAQHEVFARFVNMINAKEREETYRLSEGKLEALTALMVRSDVPIWVTPGCEDIKVKGDNNDQDTFAAFVKLIDPGNDGRSEGKSRRTDRSFFEGDLREAGENDRVWRREVESRARAEADRARSRIRALADETRSRARSSTARVRDMQHEAEMLQEQAEALQEQAEALQDAAERLQNRVDSIEDEVEELEEAEDEDRSDRAARALERRVETMRKLAAVLGQQADSLSNSSDSLYAEADQRSMAATDAETQAEAMYIEADGLRDQARNLEEQLYSLDETVSILRAAAEIRKPTTYANFDAYREIDQELVLLDTMGEVTPEIDEDAIATLSQWIGDEAVPAVADVLMDLADEFADVAPPEVTDVEDSPDDSDE